MINDEKKQAMDAELLRFLKEYQCTYNINYKILRKISDRLNANYILLVSSGVDIQSGFLKETFTSRFSFSSENTVNPQYRIVTHMVLVDTANEVILMEKNYVKNVASTDCDIAITSFSPSATQLNKFKEFSTQLSHEATPLIESEIAPELVPVKNTVVDKVMYKFGYEPMGKSNNTKETTPNEQNSQESGLDLNTNPKVKLYNYVEDDL